MAGEHAPRQRAAGPRPKDERVRRGKRRLMPVTIHGASDVIRKKLVEES